jgi:hypothetical protein
MTVNPSNETRIRQLEAQSSRLAAVAEALRAQRTGGEVDQIVRPARTCNPSVGSYPTSGEAVPIVFLDARHSGLTSSTTLSERATAQQAVAATLDGTLPAVGTDGVVIRYERQWFFIPSSSSGGGLITKVKNKSGYAVPAWGFLMVDGVEVTPTANLATFQSSPVFRGLAPTPHGVYSGKRIVSVPGGAAVDETVDCILDGRVPAKIYSQYHANPLMCHVTGDSTINDVTRMNARHKQTNYGFPVLYREGGTGEKWGIIDLMPQNGPAAFYAVLNGPYGLTIQTTASTKWQGNPFRIIQATTTTLQTAGSTMVDLLSDQTRIRIDGESDWFGELMLHLSVTHPLQAISGLPSLRQSSGAKVVVTMGAIGGGSVVYATAAQSTPPVVTSWTNFTGLTERVTLTVPFYYKAPQGRYVNNLSGFNVVIALEKSPIISGTATAIAESASLFMQEVDPMVTGWTPGGGWIPGGGVLFSSGSGGSLEQSPVIPGAAIPSSMVIVTSGGSQGSSAGFGFE